MLLVPVTGGLLKMDDDMMCKADVDTPNTRRSRISRTLDRRCQVEQSLGNHAGTRG